MCLDADSLPCRYTCKCEAHRSKTYVLGYILTCAQEINFKNDPNLSDIKRCSIKGSAVSSAVRVIMMYLCFLDSACKAGSFGLNCEQSCECAGEAPCDPSTGQCLCPPGRTGQRCERGRCHSEGTQATNEQKEFVSFF